MNEITETDRARITAIIARLISELAGSDPDPQQIILPASKRTKSTFHE
jgi:hypothetical protein